MLLFHPFRNEVEEVHNNDKILEKYNEWKETVEREQSLFEPNPEFLTWSRGIYQADPTGDYNHRHSSGNQPTAQ